MAKKEKLATVLRAAGLALFCAAFGLAGAVGGIWLMADELRGREGPQGPPGVVGPAGEAGLEGPPGPAADVSQLESEVALLRTSVRKLTPRVDELEGDVAAIDTTSDCEPGTAVKVLTSATLTKAGRNISLSTTEASVTPCS
jgi:hypothetical protein